MKSFKTAKIRSSFKLVGASNSLQAAIMMQRLFRSINFYAPPAYNAKGPKATRLANLAAELVAAAKNRLS